LAQQALTRRQRQANLREAFQLNPKRLEQLHNRHVAVIDDVMTTGTTANQIARLLLANGVSRVSIWVIARTPKSDE
jgi:predicted amidophosphoribosyltransferase